MKVANDDISFSITTMELTFGMIVVYGAAVSDEIWSCYCKNDGS